MHADEWEHEVMRLAHLGSSASQQLAVLGWDNDLFVAACMDWWAMIEVLVTQLVLAGRDQLARTIVAGGCPLPCPSHGTA